MYYFYDVYFFDAYFHCDIVCPYSGKTIGSKSWFASREAAAEWGEQSIAQLNAKK